MTKHPDGISQDDLIRIGIISRPHGLKGEVKVIPLTDFPNRFRDLASVFAIYPNGHVEKYGVSRARVLRSRVILKLKGVDSLSDAEKLAQVELGIKREDCVDLPEDTFYLFDLIGLKIVLSHGEEMGVVTDVQHFPAQDVLVVETPEGREVLVPFVRELVPEVRLEEGTITVVDLPGLFREG